MKTLLASVVAVAMVFALNGCVVGPHGHHHHGVHHHAAKHHQVRHHHEMKVKGGKTEKVVHTKKVVETKKVVPVDAEKKAN
jgi:hypothetical protein